MWERGEGGKGRLQAHGARTSAQGASRSQQLLVSRYKEVSRYNKEARLTKHKERLLTRMRMCRAEMEMEKRRCLPCLVSHILLPKCLSCLVLGLLALDTILVRIQARHVGARRETAAR